MTVRSDPALGILLTGLILAVIVSIPFPAASPIAGCLALAAAVVGFVHARGAVRAVVLVLTTIGAAGIVLGITGGNGPGLAAFASLNQDLVAMLAAVTFVRVVIPAAAPPTSGTRGWRAIVRTGFAVHLLGSVINMSALTLSAHRMAVGGRLALTDAALISRAYAAGAFWSPFWLASAATIAYLPGADTLPTIVAGAAVAAVGLLLTSAETGIAMGAERRREYHGYSLSPRVLAVPASMALLVLVGHVSIPDTPIPRLVALSAVVVAVAGLLLRGMLREVPRHILYGVASARSEATLFVAAGVLTIGLRSAVSQLGPLLPVPEYTLFVAWLSIVATIALALVGLHPIVTLSLLVAVILPLDPDPSLFMLATLLGWGAGSAVGVTSGMLMHLTSQFHVSMASIVRRNLVFAGVIAVLAWPALAGVQAVVG